jgi:uncharacterized protein with FMN-binding domain
MRRVILAICATAVGLVLLLSFKTQTQSAAPGTSPAAALGSPAPGTGAAGASASSTASSAQDSGAGGGAAKTVTGAAWPTVYGPVQVEITVKAGKITAVDVLEYPRETPRDQQLNAFAIPELNRETLAAGNAHIDTISGATYTSGGYVGSLQNALDKAGTS